MKKENYWEKEYIHKYGCAALSLLICPYNIECTTHFTLSNSIENDQHVNSRYIFKIKVFNLLLVSSRKDARKTNLK